MLITASLWPGAVSFMSLIINFVAIYYSSTKAIPFGTMVKWSGLSWSRHFGDTNAASKLDGGGGNLVLSRFPVDLIGDHHWTQLGWSIKLSLSSQSYSSPHSRKISVQRTGGDHPFGRNSSVRLDFHRNVLCVHLVLGL
jgi:hypothetical protein